MLFESGGIMEKGKIFIALDVDTKKEALEIVNDLRGLEHVLR